MNNKPVAWMIRRDENITKGIGHEIQLTLMDATRPEFWIKGKIAKGYEVFPLYTHPAKTDKAELDTRSYMLGYADGKEAKTLTDEEFISVYRTWSITSNDPLVLKAAILRKAQEK